MGTYTLRKTDDDCTPYDELSFSTEMTQQGVLHALEHMLGCTNISDQGLELVNADEPTEPKAKLAWTPETALIQVGDRLYVQKYNVDCVVLTRHLSNDDGLICEVILKGVLTALNGNDLIELSCFYYNVNGEQLPCWHEFENKQQPMSRYDERFI